MGIIRGILEEELDRLKELEVFYKEKIEDSIRGSVSVKERGGRKYLYLAHREGKKVVFEYVGKDEPEIRDALNERIRQRKEYQEKLRQVKENIKEVKRALRGKRA